MAFEGFGDTSSGHTVLAQDSQHALIEINPMTIRDDVDSQITQIVRQSQKNGKAFDWRGMISTFESIHGKNDSDVERLRSLFENLETTNPYQVRG